MYEASYDTLFRASVAPGGSLTIRELPHTTAVGTTTPETTEPVTIKAKDAKRIVADLDEVEEFYERESAEFNAVRYWILKRAFEGVSNAAR